MKRFRGVGQSCVTWGLALVTGGVGASGLGCGAGSTDVGTTPPSTVAAGVASSGTASSVASAKGAPNAKAAAADVTRLLDADDTITTASGSTFQASKAWTLTIRGDVYALASPEHDLSLTFIETKTTDTEPAIEAAWKRIAPSFARKVKNVANPPARDGWDAITQVVYETSAQESRTVFALARRKGDVLHIALVDGADAGLDRRGPQLGTALGTYKPKGIEKESFAGRQAHTLDQARLEAFTSFAEEARKATNTPGAALAIVQGGKVVLSKGFGVREAGKTEVVTAKTLFMIGSTTKSLTTLMMAKLVDEGALAWDEPVTKILPSFALGDADATKKLTVRNTVCACTGLPRQDFELLFEYKNATPESRVESMRTMKPTTGFGETFQYSNTMVAAGGYVAAHAAEPKKSFGAAYDAVLRSRVLDPLGMRASTSDFATVARSEHASPHGITAENAAKVLPLSWEEGVRAVRPAGAIWSNADEMARVLLVELGRGELDGKRIFTEANLLARRQPQVKITDKMSYGLGLFTDDDHGLQTIGHGGNNLGFTSDFWFLPESGVGLVVLTNAGDANAFRNALHRRLVEILYDGKPEASENLAFSMQRHRETLAKELANVAKRPSAPFVTEVQGAWSNPSLGKLVMKQEAERAVVDAGEWSSAFGEKTESGGSKSVVLLDPPWLGLELVVENKDGKKSLVFETGQQRYVFTRDGK